MAETRTHPRGYANHEYSDHPPEAICPEHGPEATNIYQGGSHRNYSCQAGGCDFQTYRYPCPDCANYYGRLAEDRNTLLPCDDCASTPSAPEPAESGTTWFYTDGAEPCPGWKCDHDDCGVRATRYCEPCGAPRCDKHLEAPCDCTGPPDETPGSEAWEEWPGGVSSGLTLPCWECGTNPRIDYRVTDEFWARWVPAEHKRDVWCLPCLDVRCGGVGLADALVEIQWCGTGHTVVARPTLRHEYQATDAAPIASPPEPVASTVLDMLEAGMVFVMASKTPETKLKNLYATVVNVRNALRNLQVYEEAGPPTLPPEQRAALVALVEAAQGVMDSTTLGEGDETSLAPARHTVEAVRDALASPALRSAVAALKWGA